MKSLFLSLMTISFAMGASAQVTNEEITDRLKTEFTCKDWASGEVVENFDFFGYPVRNCMSALTVDGEYAGVSNVYYLTQQSINGCLYSYSDPKGQNEAPFIVCTKSRSDHQE